MSEQVKEHVEQIEFSQIPNLRANLLSTIINAVRATILEAEQQTASNQMIKTQSPAFKVRSFGDNPSNFFYNPMIQATRLDDNEIAQLQAKRRIADAKKTLDTLVPIECALSLLKDGEATLEVYKVLDKASWKVPQLDQLCENVIPPSGIKLGYGSDNE